MSLLKFAYVRGAQNALVSSGAIQPYRSEFQADLAVKLAAMAIEDESAEEVSDEELAQAMAAMASNAEEDLSEEEIKEVLEAAEDGEEELAELVESAGDSDEMSEEEAREVVAYLKSAAAAKGNGHVNSVANSLHKGVPNFQTEEGARADQAYAHLGGAQGLADPKKNAVPFTASVQPLQEGASLDAKTAAAILRKLSEDAAGGGSANALGGAGLNGSSSDYQTEEPPRKNPAYANVDQGLAQGDSNAVPFSGSKKDLSDDNAAAALNIGSGGADKNAAFNYLLAKTAEEVGPFLPSNLNNMDKLAALRAMMGMSQPERAQYIQRVKWAMEEDEDSKNEKKEKDDDDSDKDSKGLTAAQKKLPKELREAIEEKNAHQILRQLGLGY